MPDTGELVSSLHGLGGGILVCDLCVEATGVREEDLRPGVEIVGITTFLADTTEATRTFSF
jgi:predicted peroxiredoxin